MVSFHADMYLVSRGAAVRASHTSAAEARRHRFEQIYAANHAAITGYVLRRTDSPDDAADVIAETFLACWRRLGDVPDGDGTRLLVRPELITPDRARQCADAGGERRPAQRPPAARATAAAIGRACGLTASPATRTVGVASTPAAMARAVT